MAIPNLCAVQESAVFVSFQLRHSTRRTVLNVCIKLFRDLCVGGDPSYRVRVYMRFQESAIGGGGIGRLRKKELFPPTQYLGTMPQTCSETVQLAGAQEARVNQTTWSTNGFLLGEYWRQVMGLKLSAPAGLLRGLASSGPPKCPQGYLPSADGRSAVRTTKTPKATGPGWFPPSPWVVQVRKGREVNAGRP